MGKRRFETTLFRYVPGDSPIHRLWAGTKILGLIVVTIAVTLSAGWLPFLVCGLFIILVFFLSKLPLSTLKLLPGWLVVFAVVVDLGFSFLSGGKPILHLGNFKIAIGGFLNATEFLIASAEILFLIGLVSWTTSLAEITSSLRKLAGPFKSKSAFVEYINTFALMIRAIPLVTEDIRIMVASRRLNGFGKEAIANASRVREVFAEIYDFAHLAITTTLRRAQEIAVAMIARGGYGERVAYESKPTRKDHVAVVVLLLISASIIVSGLVS